MAKRVTHAVRRTHNRGLGRIDRETLLIGCDDGTTYKFVRATDSPRWSAVARYGREGDRSAEPSRLPAAVEAHMDGRTGSGPHGDDGDEYWV